MGQQRLSIHTLLPSKHGARQPLTGQHHCQHTNTYDVEPKFDGWVDKESSAHGGGSPK